MFLGKRHYSAITQDKTDDMVPTIVWMNGNEGWDLGYGDERAGQVPRHFKGN